MTLPTGPSSARVAVLVPAAGSGTRMGGARKPLLTLGGRSVLSWALEPFLTHPNVVEIVVALGPEEDLPDDLPASALTPRRVLGGASRFESVRNAFAVVGEDLDVVVVHDGARPFPPRETVARCIELASEGVGAVAGIPAVDTIKAVERGRISSTPDRSRLWYAQTPQCFPADSFREALQGWPKDGPPPTDDAMLLESIGLPVEMVSSSPRNLKVTHAEDLVLAEALIREGLISS